MTNRPKQFLAQNPCSDMLTLTVFYGWLTDRSGALTQSASRITAADPDVLVAAYRKADGSPNVTSDFVAGKNRMKIYSYVASGWTRKNIASVASEIADAAGKSDGIFLDEVSSMKREDDLAYYSRIYDEAKKHNLGVVANPGMIGVHRRIMDVSDILCLEHQWEQADMIPWKNDYPPSRLMGISLVQSKNAAIKASTMAAGLGMGYHYSASFLTELDPWYERYIEKTRKLKAGALRSSFSWLHKTH